MAKKKKNIWVNTKQINNLSSRTIQVRISSFEKGLEIFNDIKIIRITSSTYTLLIMEGFQPQIGEIEGKVTLISEHKEYELPECNAFFCFRKNVFKLVIQENANVY